MSNELICANELSLKSSVIPFHVPPTSSAASLRFTPPPLPHLREPPCTEQGEILAAALIKGGMIHGAGSAAPGGREEWPALSAANGLENALGQLDQGTDL